MIFVIYYVLYNTHSSPPQLHHLLRSLLLLLRLQPTHQLSPSQTPLYQFTAKEFDRGGDRGLMGNMGQFGDTALTKVFVGGLAWETQKETLKDHFEKYGDILEAVIISDKITGRSKGYGFVTFKETEGAKKACEDPTPVINGRRANCNLASLGARRLRGSHSPNPPHHQPPPPVLGMAVAAARVVTTPPPPPITPGQWFYPSGAPHPQAFHHQYHGIPFYAAYGYSPNLSYMADVGCYNAKLNHSAGGGGGGGGGLSYLQTHFSQGPYPGQGGIMSSNGMLPMYNPFYNYHHQQHQSQGMGLPAAAHMFPQTTAGHMTTMPTTLVPTAMPPTQVEQVTGCS